MEPPPIDPWKPRLNIPFQHSQKARKTNVHFQRFLNEQVFPLKTGTPAGGKPDSIFVYENQPTAPPAKLISRQNAAAAYYKQEKQVNSVPSMSALQKYKDDQLLSNPGGDHYYLAQKKVIPNPKEQASFWGRIKKDVSDAFGNVKNFFHNFLFGAKMHYRDENNQIRECKKQGFVGSVVEFFKDVGSAFTFGAWRPDGEEKPEGFLKRTGFFFSKMKEAVFGDMVEGVGGSIINMGEDILFAGWNLIETIPDATIGNVKAGRKWTTDIFDNGQVVLDYLTDIIPTGEAWIRVHSPDLKKFKLPIYNNIRMPERNMEDDRWKYVRNTPFRKTIETIGSLFMDVLALDISGQIRMFSEKKK
ncbi:MAG: hypothetical protein JRJ85_14335 [Deltaproteobacteria bacterium]|nr:hypothetical protein [Deltaproteobacteria bacterium]